MSTLHVGWLLWVLLGVLLPAVVTAQGIGWNERIAAGLQAYREGRLEEAERSFAEAVTFAERTTPHEWYLVTSLSKLADTVRAQGREEDAEALYQKALTVAEKLRGDDHPGLIDPIKALAGFYARVMRYAEAERLYERALALFRKNHAREAAASLHLLSDLLRAQAKYTEAEMLLRQALTLLEPLGGADELSLGSRVAILSDLGMLLRIQGKIADSETVAERAVNLFAQEFDKLEPLFRQALAGRIRALGPDHPGLVNTLYYLARLLETRERYDEAESFHRRALEILNTPAGADAASLAAGLETYGTFLRKRGRETEARLREARAAAIRATSKRQEAAATPIADRH